MSRNNKRKATMKHFKQNNIIDNNELKKYYVEESSRMIDGKKEKFKNCLVGWRLKEIETNCMIDTSDDFEG